MADPTSDKSAKGAQQVSKNRRFTGDPSTLPRPKPFDHALSEGGNDPAASVSALDQPTSNEIKIANMDETHHTPALNSPKKPVKPRVKQLIISCYTR